MVKPNGTVLARVPKGAVSGSVRLGDTWGQVHDSPVTFAVGTLQQLREVQSQFRFPVRGPHTYGGPEAGFGAAGMATHTKGYDIFAVCGTPLVAAHTGVVKARGYQSAAGNYVVIDGGKQDHMYAHLRAPARVLKGQEVTTGQAIGKVGDTGNAQGCHLHFEIWVGKGWYTGGAPVDPAPHPAVLGQLLLASRGCSQRSGQPATQMPGELRMTASTLRPTLRPMRLILSTVRAVSSLLCLPALSMAAPANDDLADAEVIDSISTVTTYLSRSNAGATTEPGETTHRGRPALKSVWFEYTAPAHSFVYMNTCTGLQDPEPKMDVYTGDSYATLVSVADPYGHLLGFL